MMGIGRNGTGFILLKGFLMKFDDSVARSPCQLDSDCPVLTQLPKAVKMGRPTRATLGARGSRYRWFFDGRYFRQT